MSFAIYVLRVPFSVLKSSFQCY